MTIKNDKYTELNICLENLIRDVDYQISNLANASALLWQNLKKINWAGFYIIRNGHLELGPFQGKIACTKIEIGHGVCGTAVAENRTIVVPDVHKFPGHIACDCNSNSEIVVPIHKDGKIWGVLDIDSPYTDRFNNEDTQGLEQFVSILERVL